MKINPIAGVTVILIAALGGTIVFGTDASSNNEVKPSGSVPVAESSDSRKGTAVESRLEELEREYDEASAAVGFEPPTSYQPDPEIVRGIRHSAELNEMLCKTQGINCDAAKLFRKQYEEMASGL